MTAIIFKAPGTIATPLMGKYSPLDFIKNSDGSSPLYAAYIHGADFFVGAPTPIGASAGSPWLGDLSGNSRTLTLTTGAGTGAGTNAKGFNGNINNYLTTPFTGDQIAAAGTTPNEFEAVVAVFSPGIAVPANANNRPVFNKTSGFSRGMSMEITSSYDMTVEALDDTQTRTSPVGNPISSWRDTDYEIGGGGPNLTSVAAWRGHAGAAITESILTWTTTTGTRAVGGPAFKLAVSAVTDASKIQSVTLFYNRRLTSAERVTVDAKLRSLLAAYGVTA